ncbi:hypothetical protein MMG00_11765 [Ignatzschineria rhizosphaerae]|uniref:Uncharacterized protein n=1 Tax=Ignatzschineria rhizosphaerae TaxID=2923279 RepID=A0ABY3WZ17_9GAMM|nr:hypothetical protein [Ignatzschineria rhizosphaerae]UNM95862.1 hypothetical protein MMG00_11765 [Ignatzschineria rhizosphaerae]
MIIVVIAFIAIIISLVYLLREKTASIRFGIPLAIIIVAIITFFIFQNYLFPYDQHTPMRASEQSQIGKEKAREARMQSRERQNER